MKIPKGDLDVLTIGETLVDFISVEETDWLRNAYTFRKYQGGSPANIAVYVAKLGGQSAVISKTGIGAMGQFLKAELGRAGVTCDYLVEIVERKLATVGPLPDSLDRKQIYGVLDVDSGHSAEDVQT